MIASVLLGEVSVQVFCPRFNWIGFLIVAFSEFAYIFNIFVYIVRIYKSFVRYVFCKYFPGF